MSRLNTVLNKIATLVMAHKEIIGNATMTTTAQTLTGAVNELDGDITSLNGNIEKLNGAAIPSNANLNSYNTVGEYYAPSNAIASSLTNRPSDLTVAFSMLVLNKGGTNIQTIFTNGGNIYLRGQISTGWQGWVKFSGSSI